MRLREKGGKLKKECDFMQIFTRNRDFTTALPRVSGRFGEKGFSEGAELPVNALAICRVR